MQVPFNTNSGAPSTLNRADSRSIVAMLLLALTLLSTGAASAFLLAHHPNHAQNPRADATGSDFTKTAFRELVFSTYRRNTGNALVPGGDDNDSTNRVLAPPVTWPLPRCTPERSVLPVADPFLLTPRPLQDQPHSPRAPPSAN